MNPFLLALLLSHLVLSFKSASLEGDQKNRVGKTYSTNLPTFGIAYSMTLTGNAKELTAHRTQLPISSSFINDMLFFDAKHHRGNCQGR